MIEALDLDRLETAVELAEVDHTRVQLDAGMARLLLDHVRKLETALAAIRVILSEFGAGRIDFAITALDRIRKQVKP